jgi:hypothetical protein
MYKNQQPLLVDEKTNKQCSMIKTRDLTYFMFVLICYQGEPAKRNVHADLEE